MSYRRSMAVVLAGLILATPSAFADRGRGGFHDGGSRVTINAPGYGYQHAHGGRNFWGPFGLVVGSALLYSALQPRTTYSYESRTIYAPYPSYTPPPVTVYYAPPPAPVVQYYAAPSVPATTVTVIPAPTNSYPAQVMVETNVQAGVGASGAQWWYMCRQPAGYHPHIKECPSGWEKVAPAPQPYP